MNCEIIRAFDLCLDETIQQAMTKIVAHQDAVHALRLFVDQCQAVKSEATQVGSTVRNGDGRLLDEDDGFEQAAFGLPEDRRAA